MEESDKSKLEAYKNLKSALDDDAPFEEIEALIKTLKETGDETDKERCDQVLRVARIRHGKSQDIIKDLKKDKSSNPFLYVYALHSLGEQSKAHENFNSLNLDKSDYYNSLLLAQILYKLDQKEKASELYEEALNSSHASLEHDLNEILINLLASYTVNVTDEETLKKVDEKLTGEVNSDFVFNSATAYAAAQNLQKQAAKKLKESYEIAKEHEEENTDKFFVLSTYISAQILSQATNLGEFDWSSLKIDESDAKKFKATENEVAFLTNIACIKTHMGIKESNTSLASKLSNALKSKDVNQHQKEILFLNLLNLSLRNNKVSEVRKMVGDIAQLGLDFSDQFTNRLQIASLLLENKHSEALEKVKEPSNTFEALCRAQIQVSSGHFQQAISDLIHFCKSSSVSNPRLLCFLLKATIDNRLTEEKKQIIDLCVSNANSLPKDILVMIGQILIEDQNFLKALEVFEQVQSEDKKIKAAYLSALAESDLDKAKKYLEEMDFDMDMETDEDLHELLEEPLAPPSKKKRAKKAGDKIEETKAGGKIFIPKAKTKKKIKYPKNFDPENPGPMPDPERWIPKWQRSKGKKKLRMKGPQGDVRNIGAFNKKDHSTANMDVAGDGKRKK